MTGLSRYIVTVEMTKHRIFQFLPAEVAPDHSTIVIASADAFHLSVLSRRVHVVWAWLRGAARRGAKLGMVECHHFGIRTGVQKGARKEMVSRNSLATTGSIVALLPLARLPLTWQMARCPRSADPFLTGQVKSLDRGPKSIQHLFSHQVFRISLPAFIR